MIYVDDEPPFLAVWFARSLARLSAGGTAKHVPAFALSASFVVSLGSVQTRHVPAGKRSLHSPSLTPDFPRCARRDVFRRDLLRPRTSRVSRSVAPLAWERRSRGAPFPYVLDISRGVFGLSCLCWLPRLRL